MSKRVIGLDIGTAAVRLAEIERGSEPMLRSFGQVALPPDAVQDGEIIDQGAVAEAIARLFSQLAIKRGARVRVGLANPRTIVRPIELPAMEAGDLDGALRFSIADLIPIPIDEAVYDFRVLETFTAENGAAMVRVLLAAAHRSSVRGVLEAVRAAGVEASAIDPAPLALIRALDLHQQHSQLLVSIGAGITMVVVDDQGLPRFVRTVPLGGRSVDVAIGAALQIDPTNAEALRIAGSVGMAGASAEDAGIGRLIETVRSSLDFHLAQPGASVPAKVVITGGMSRDERLLPRLQDALGLPVEIGRPREEIATGDLGFSPDDLQDVDAVLAVPLGLALGGLNEAQSINLGREFISEPITGARSGVVAATLIGALLIGGLGYLSFNRVQEHHEIEEQVASLEATNAGLGGKIATLQPVADLDATVGSQRQLVEPLLASDVAWSRVLEDLRASIPANVWIVNFQGSAGPGSATADNPSALGTVTFEASSLGLLDVRDWIRTIETASTLDSVWVSSAAVGGGAGASGDEFVTFSSNAALEPSAASCRLEGLDDPERCP